ncbi:hypothetical protein [Microbacterium sp.]|uniref:hypothetical protein n=1 Tax=Microbacterium sp. TaxID=51671 RepID=UPI002612EBC7|nr:hypothetical protein [Microbacterium sp.]
MKKTRLAVTAAISSSLLAGSMLLAAPALAADVYVPDAPKGVEGDSYPAGWFTGNPQPETAPVDDETGITLTGKTQLLYGGIIDVAGPDTFTSLVESSAVDADGDTYFQYPIFFNPDGENLGFTTLRPVDPGTPATDAEWYSSWEVRIDGEVILTEGPHTFAEIQTAFQGAIDAGAAPEVLAVGVFVDTGAEALVRSISFAGDNYYFTEEPEAVVPVPVEEEATFAG